MYQTEDKISDYILVKFLGRGQYGEVWLAEKRLQFSTRPVRHALKFLYKQGDESVDLKAAESEIDTWIEASGHPNVMSVIDMLVHDGRMIIVSEYAEGGSLKNWLQKNAGCAPSPEAALEMLRGVLCGIEHLHSRSVVHRDLKPDNILLQGDFPRITDFGISRIVSESTMSTKAIGSPAYMSPEAFDGDKRAQADLWAAGVILYEMLAGSYPFDSETVFGLFTAIRSEPMKPLSESVPPACRMVVGKSLEKDLRSRYQTATEMRQAIERAIFELKTTASQETELKILVLTPPVQTQADGKADDVQVQPPTSAETIPLDAPVLRQSDAQENFINSAPTVASSATQKLETDQTGGEYVEQTADYIVPETIVAHQSPPENFSASFADFSLSSEASKISSRQNNSKRLVAGLSGGLLGLMLLVGAGWLAISRFSPNAANVAEKTNANPSAPENMPVNSPKDVTPPEGMAYVPGGMFTMGRDDGASEAEKPAHQVTVKPFFMDIYEVTNEQGSGGYTILPLKLPNVNADWESADNYCQAREKRLPTEEEWEFAARGTQGYLYPWGNEWDGAKANVGTKGFADVGQYRGASPFGIYDLSGNAWEWTASDFKAYPGGKLPAAFAGKKNLKTIRGGSFEATKDYATTTYRIGWAATGAGDYSRTGFRCVKDLDK